MDEDTPHARSNTLLHYSEEEWVRYVHELEKGAATSPQVALETCTHIETQVHTLESGVEALHATMQQYISMCAEKGQSVQQIQQECETLRADFKDLTARVSFSFGQVNDSLMQVESEAQTWREHVERTLGYEGPHPQASDWGTDRTAQLEKSLQAHIKNLCEENHIALTKLDSKVEQLSESSQGIGQTFQAHADSVHTEVLRLQSAFQSRPPLVETSSLASLQERQVLFEQHIQDSVSQQLYQFRAEMSRSPPWQVVYELVSHMESQAKEIRQLRQCLRGLMQEKSQVQREGCPPSS